MHETLLLGSRCPLDHRTRRNPENRDLEASSWGPPHDEPFRATLTAFDDAWGGPFPDGGPGPDIPSRPDGQEGHLPGCLASPTEAGRGRREAAFARSASARLWKCPPHHRTCRNPENRDWRPRPGDPPHDKPFRATRQHSTTRGEAPFQRGGATPCRGGRGSLKGRGVSGPLPPLQGKSGSREAFRALGHSEHLALGLQNQGFRAPGPVKPGRGFNTLG